MPNKVWMALPRDTARFIRLAADEVDESDSKYCVFHLGGEVIGRVLKEHILAWWIDESSFEETATSEVAE